MAKPALMCQASSERGLDESGEGCLDAERRRFLTLERHTGHHSNTRIKPMLVYSFRRAGAHGTNVEQRL
jgi:hypothetical protein